HALELIEVGTVEREDVARSPVVARATVRFADVDALRAERLADDRENSGLVRGRHAELNRAVDLRPRVPLHVDAPLGLGIEGPLTLAPVNRDATSARDEADDPVARQRIATLRVAHEHVVDPAHANAARLPSGDLADQLFDA